MKAEDILYALNDIDPALTKKPANRLWILPAAAAVLAFLIAAPFFFWPKSAPRTPKTTVPEVATVDENGRALWVDKRQRNEKAGYTQDSALIYPWEYLTEVEKYPSVTLDNKVYRTRAQEISEALLGDVLGTGQAQGYDIYEEKAYTQEFTLRQIQGQDPEYLVAANIDGWYVFIRDRYDPPQTLGEFLDRYQIPACLSLTQFGLYENWDSKGNYLLDTGSSQKVFQMLEKARNAAWSGFTPELLASTRYASFTAASSALGISNKVFYVLESGYIMTNCTEYGFGWNIGPELGQELYVYITENSAPYSPARREAWLCGYVTEVGDGFIRVDDSAMMKDPADGRIFTVLTPSLELSRVMDFGGVDVGSFVAVTYDGIIYADEPDLIRGATSIAPAILSDGQVLIPE